MTNEQRAKEILIFVALLKATTDQSTYLINEFQFKKKKDFNELIKHIDRYLANQEQILPEETKELLEETNQYFNQAAYNLKQIIVKQ